MTLLCYALHLVCIFILVTLWRKLQRLAVDVRSVKAKIKKIGFVVTSPKEQ